MPTESFLFWPPLRFLAWAVMIFSKSRSFKTFLTYKSSQINFYLTKTVTLAPIPRQQLYLSICILWRNPFNGCKDPEMFLHGQHIKDDVELGANPHQLFHFQTCCNLCHRGAVDGCRAVGWWADATQDVQERRFASSAVSQQSCDLTLVDVKRQT